MYFQWKKKSVIHYPFIRYVINSYIYIHTYICLDESFDRGDYAITVKFADTSCPLTYE